LFWELPAVCKLEGLAFWSSELTSSSEDLLPHHEFQTKNPQPQLSDLKRSQYGHSNCSETYAGHPSQNDAANSCESMGVSLTYPLPLGSFPKVRGCNHHLRRCWAFSSAATVTDAVPSPSFVYRENRVPYYQRLFQSHDGKRQWWKVC
jgi:hypothetical protein